MVPFTIFLTYRTLTPSGKMQPLRTIIAEVVRMHRLLVNVFVFLSCLIGMFLVAEGAEPVVKPEQVIENHLN